MGHILALNTVAVTGLAGSDPPAHVYAGRRKAPKRLSHWVNHDASASISNF